MTESVLKPIQIRLLALLLVVPYGLMAYPVFGMKRYGRSTTSHPQNNWGAYHVPSYYYQALPRPQTYHPLSYYDAMNLYAPEYDDYLYPQDTPAYPLYYPLSRPGSSNYDFYQPVVPYYYTPNPYGYYDNTDPIEDLQEQVLQDEERETREDAYPIGQKIWFEPEGTEGHDESLDDVNAAFMENLMLYNKAMSQPNYMYDQIQPDYEQYGDANSWNPNPYTEDKNEQELHMLTEAPKKEKTNKKQERMQMFNNKNRNQKNNFDPNDSESWLKYNKNKRTKGFTSRKPQTGRNNEPTSTTSPISSTLTSATRDSRGQKEVVMMRPATPVRRPFSEPVMQLLAQQGGPERKRTPSVYDTIKHMLEMEKSLEKEYRNKDYRPAMRKRYVSSEESLVDELVGLKKTA